MKTPKMNLASIKEKLNREEMKAIKGGITRQCVWCFPENPDAAVMPITGVFVSEYGPNSYSQCWNPTTGDMCSIIYPGQAVTPRYGNCDSSCRSYF